MDDLESLLPVRAPRYKKLLEEREKQSSKSHWHFEPGAPGVGRTKTLTNRGKLWMMDKSNTKNVSENVIM